MKKIIAGLLFVPIMAHAEFENGNTLLGKLSSSEVPERINAYGYVAGVFDSHKGVTHCASNSVGITVGQIADIAKAYIYSNPSIRNYSADLLLRDAFRQVWPCPNKPKNPGVGV